jgi:hypothetical protein
MEPENVLSYSQEAATRPSYWPDESSFHHKHLFSRGVRVEEGNIPSAREYFSKFQGFNSPVSVGLWISLEPSSRMFQIDDVLIQFCSIRELSQSELEATCCLHVCRKCVMKSKQLVPCW